MLIIIIITLITIINNKILSKIATTTAILVNLRITIILYHQVHLIHKASKVPPHISQYYVLLVKHNLDSLFHRLTALTIKRCKNKWSKSRKTFKKNLSNWKLIWRHCSKSDNQIIWAMPMIMNVKVGFKVKDLVFNILSLIDQNGSLLLAIEECILLVKCLWKKIIRILGKFKICLILVNSKVNWFYSRIQKVNYGK